MHSSLCRIFLSSSVILSPTSSLIVQELVTAHSVLITSKDEDAVKLEKRKDKEKKRRKILDIQEPCFRLKMKRFRIKDQSDVFFLSLRGDADFKKWENNEENVESKRKLNYDGSPARGPGSLTTVLSMLHSHVCLIPEDIMEYREFEDLSVNENHVNFCKKNGDKT